MAETVLQWPEVKAYLSQRLGQVLSRLVDAQGEDVVRLQSEAKTLRSLQSLPETLMMLREKPQE